MLAAALLLTGCSAAEPEPEALTVSAAGARYLDAVCPVNDAWDAVDVEVDRLRLVVGRGEAGDTAPLVLALGTLEDVSAQAAERLADDSVTWPGEAETAVSGVRETLAADAEQAAAAAKLSGAEAVEYRWEGSETVAAASAAAREALGLPEDSGEACRARAKQSAAAAE